MRWFLLYGFAAFAVLPTAGCVTDCTELTREAAALKDELGAC